MVFIAAEKPHKIHPQELLIVVNRGELLCPLDEQWRLLKAGEVQLPEAQHQHYLGTWNGKHCYVLFYRSSHPCPTPPGFHWVRLRSQLGKCSQSQFDLAGKALQFTRWFRDHQFCGVCGSPTRESGYDRALVCKQCESRFYPRISPCVIGLITHGRKCLLARGSRHPEGMYSTLAGFIEPGESAEQAFAREVREEVGVSVKNIRYVASQPWPFPGQLMLAYTAEYAEGEIVVDGEEILEASWFDVDKLPTIPPVQTISGRLIEDFMQKHG